MNVYDFDRTIYQGDSSVDFMIFCISHSRNSRKAIPRILIAGVKYFFKTIDTKQFKELFFSFLKELSTTEVERLLFDFWTNHQDKIADWYKQQKKLQM